MPIYKSLLKKVSGIKIPIQMNNLPANILNELIKNHSIKLIKEPKRCEALLRDKCENKYRREIFVLIKAIKEGIPKDLLNTPPESRDEALFLRLVRRLCDNVGLNKVAALWAVSTWVSVLKIKLIIPNSIETSKPKPPPQKLKSLPKPRQSLSQQSTNRKTVNKRGKKIIAMISLGIISIMAILVIIAFKEKNNLNLQKIQQQITAEKARLVAIQEEINSTIEAKDKVLAEYNQEKKLSISCKNNQLLLPKMVNIPEGRFLMGNIQGKGNPDEQPVHSVNIASFSIGRYEITFEEYDSYAKAMGKKPPDGSGWERANRPVINVSWYDSVAYANCLSLQTGYKYRLPTEAEWEYAARAGMNTQYSWGNKTGYYQANCTDCSPLPKNQTVPVNSLKANSFGLYNMQGNVSEWTCSKADNQYRGKEQKCAKPNRQNTQSMIIRGGSWKSTAKEIRTSARARAMPNERNNTLGFRLVKE